MKVLDFSVKKIIVDTAILGAFIYANVCEYSQLTNVFIYFFWLMNILCFVVTFGKPSAYFSDKRIGQGFYTELIFALVFAYFGYYVLATLGFFITIAYLGSRSTKQMSK